MNWCSLVFVWLAPGLAVAPVARSGFSVSLYLIGARLSAAGLKRAGWHPLAHGLALWILVATVTLFCIRIGWIGLWERA